MYYFIICIIGVFVIYGIILFIKGIVMFIKPLKNCQHEWKYSMFQRLTDDHSATYRCDLCGAYAQLFKKEANPK